MARIIIESDLDAFLASLDTVNPKDDAAFRNAMAGAVLHTSCLGAEDFSRRFGDRSGAGWASVPLWVLGVTSPHPALRPKLLRAAKEFLLEIRVESDERSAQAREIFDRLKWSVQMPDPDDDREDDPSR